jgi:hypothetical protein
MNREKLAQFAQQKYLNLESYRRNGEGVRTPLWFAEAQGALYLYTLADSWKIKRIRNNPHVRIVPSNARGAPKGEWIDATARILEPSAGARVHELLRRKYGWQKRIAELFSRFSRKERAFLEVTPD